MQAVAAKAERLSALVSSRDGEVMTAAAWLHGVGYSSTVSSSGSYALDGARYLLQCGFNHRVANLVAYHSCALLEAEERGLEKVLREEFVDEESAVRDALWYADMTTGPDGHSVSVGERLSEIRQRYGRDDIVTQF